MQSSKGRTFVDEKLLNAILTIDTFRHGARSIESILAMSGLETQVFGRNDLPKSQQLNLHVDEKEFNELLDKEFKGFVEDDLNNFRNISWIKRRAGGAYQTL